MKPSIIRARMAAMTRRMDKELAILDRTFPRVDLANDFGDSCEVIRNLATAAKYAASFAAMSDEGIQREIDAYGPSVSSPRRASPSNAPGDDDVG